MIRCLLPVLLLASPLAAAEPDPADKRIVQTVQRLGTFDYAKASPKIKEAIGRYLGATAGSDEYFQLVEKYRIADQQDALLTLARERAGTPAAGQATKLLFELGGGERVAAAIRELPADQGAALLETVAGVGAQATTEAAVAALTDAKSAAALQEAAAKGLGRHAEGQRALLAAAKSGSLPEAARRAASAALAGAADEAVRKEAAALLPTDGAAAMPAVADLVKRTGDAAKGQVVHQTWCFTCHQVNGQGVDFGPALSEIGSKLAKEALYEAILKPSAGISFGFEGWEVKMTDGTTWIGMVASETDTELSLKVPGGIIQKCAKSAIASRTKLKDSLMTPNLHAVIPADDLVNLVEYLTTLRKKP